MRWKLTDLDKQLGKTLELKDWMTSPLTFCQLTDILAGAPARRDFVVVLPATTFGSAFGGEADRGSLSFVLA